MKIQNLRLESLQGISRVAATVTWEDSGRPTQEIYFSAPEEFADFLYPNPDSYLAGCIFPAIDHGEQRIKVDGAVCPELIEGIRTAVGWFHHWYQLDWNMPRIEAKVRSKALKHPNSRSAGSFLSGGVDSLALLRSNHLTYSETHPRFIKYCFLVYGFDMGDKQTKYGKQKEAFVKVSNSLSQVAEAANVTLIPVCTNIRHLQLSPELWVKKTMRPYSFFSSPSGNPVLNLWMKINHGATLCSVAHCFTPIMNTMFVASSLDIEHMEPWGSHPLIDPCYGSADMRIIHHGVTDSRLEKIKLVAQWEPALQVLRVCTQINSWAANPAGPQNCGECERCVRAMTALLAIGALQKTSAFPSKDVSPALLSKTRPFTGYPQEWDQELFELLMKQGRGDLVQAIKRSTRIYLIRSLLKLIDKKLLKTRLWTFRKKYYLRQNHNR